MFIQRGEIFAKIFVTTVVENIFIRYIYIQPNLGQIFLGTIECESLLIHYIYFDSDMYRVLHV